MARNASLFCSSSLKSSASWMTAILTTSAQPAAISRDGSVRSGMRYVLRYFKGSFSVTLSGLALAGALGYRTYGTYARKRPRTELL